MSMFERRRQFEIADFPGRLPLQCCDAVFSHDCE